MAKPKTKQKKLETQQNKNMIKKFKKLNRNKKLINAAKQKT